MGACVRSLSATQVAGVRRGPSARAGARDVAPVEKGRRADEFAEGLDPRRRGVLRGLWVPAPASRPCFSLAVQGWPPARVARMCVAGMPGAARECWGRARSPRNALVRPANSRGRGLLPFLRWRARRLASSRVNATSQRAVRRAPDDCRDNRNARAAKSVAALHGNRVTAARQPPVHVIATYFRDRSKVVNSSQLRRCS